MTPQLLNSILIWGTLACLIAAGVGMRRAWIAGRHQLALVPLWLLLAGLFVVPFVLGYLGAGTLGVWLGRSSIPLTALVGLVMFFRFRQATNV